MAEFAYTKSNEPIVASSLSTNDWAALKASYSIGDFTMPCCAAVAIPKTSPNGRNFFAHHFGECTTAPESKWHLDAKQLVAFHLRSAGIECLPEKEGGTSGRNWIADIFFTFDGRQVALELQHSYQSLAQYRERQQRYQNSGVECYWLLYGPRYNTLILSMSKWRIKHEFNGKIPKPGFFGCVSDLPVAFLETEPSIVVRGAHLGATLHDWLTSILAKRFQWKDGAWLVSANPEPQ